MRFLDESAFLPRSPSVFFGFALGAVALACLDACSGAGTLQPPLSAPIGQRQSMLRSSDAAERGSLSVVSAGVPRLHVGTAPRGFVDTAALLKSPRRIAVSDASNEAVHVYNAAGTQIAQLTGFYEPQGMSSDRAGRLFVADTGNQRVQIYPAGLKGPPATLADPVGFPSDVDSFSDGKVVAVANIYNAPCCAQGSVSFFTGGTLTSTIASAALAKAYFCAFDASGNLYVDGEDVNNNFIMGEIVGGAKGTQFQTLTTNNSILGPGGIQISTSGRIAILDQSAATVYTYDTPKQGSLGSPITITHLTQALDPVTFAFTDRMWQLYTADAGIFASQAFAYPRGGDARSTINVGGQPTGVALFPAQVPGR